jgi:hypothetical protein
MFLLLLWGLLIGLPSLAKKECPLACPDRCAPKPPLRPLVCPSKTAFKLVGLQDEQFFTFLDNQQYWDALQYLSYDSTYNITSYYQWNCHEETGPTAEWLATLNPGDQFESRIIKMEYIESTGAVIVDSFVAQFTDATRTAVKSMFRGQRTWYAVSWCDYGLKEFMLWDVHCAHSHYVVTDWDCNVPRCIPNNTLAGTFTPLPPIPSLPPVPPSKQPRLFKQDHRF